MQRERQVIQVQIQIECVEDKIKAELHMLTGAGVCDHEVDCAAIFQVKIEEVMQELNELDDKLKAQDNGKDI